MIMMVGRSWFWLTPAWRNRLTCSRHSCSSVCRCNRACFLYIRKKMHKWSTLPTSWSCILDPHSIPIPESNWACLGYCLQSFATHAQETTVRELGHVLEEWSELPKTESTRLLEECGSAAEIMPTGSFFIGKSTLLLLFREIPYFDPSHTLVYVTL